MRILLVEDDKFFRDFYAFKLTQKQVTVEVAGDGEEGLAKIIANPPDLVLLDLVMPKKDGFEVLEGIKEKGLQVPVLVFSTLGQMKDVERARDLGAKGYINKNFYDFETLFAKIMALSKK